MSATAAFPFGHVREIEIAGTIIRALRITYVGELGWELHVPLAATGAVFDALTSAGEEFGIRPVGYRAIESLRLEKGYRAWGSDITPNDSPFEAGLGWAVKLRKNTDFIGRAPSEAINAKPLKKCLAAFTVADSNVVLLGRETILRNGESLPDTSPAAASDIRSENRSDMGMCEMMKALPATSLREGKYELIIANERFAAELHHRTALRPAERESESLNGNFTSILSEPAMKIRISSTLFRRFSRRISSNGRPWLEFHRFFPKNRRFLPNFCYLLVCFGCAR